MRYPLAGQLIKRTIIALSVTNIVYFTGGLAAILLLASMVAKLGMLIVLTGSPVIDVTLAALWCASKFFYPHYAIRKEKTLNTESPDSTKELLNSLGINRSPVQSIITNSILYHRKSLLQSASNGLRKQWRYDSRQENLPTPR